MGTYKEESLRAKAVREGIVEQRSQLPKSRKPRPIVVEYRYRKTPWSAPPGEWGPWKTWGRYGKLDAAQQAMAAQLRANWRKGRYEYRVKETT